MKNYILFSLLLTATSILFAQDNCSTFYPMIKGASMEYTNYDKKGKVDGVSTFKVINTSSTGDTTNAVMAINFKDKKGNEVYSTDYKLSCTGNMVTLDYESLLPTEMMKQYKDMDIQVSGNDIEIPNNLSVGQQLKDSNVSMTMNMGAMKMNISVDMINRKVEKMETVTTTAGTFECYVLYSENQTKAMMVNKTSPSRVWLAEGVGMIKQETFKKNGDVMVSTQLTSFSK